MSEPQDPQATQGAGAGGAPPTRPPARRLSSDNVDLIKALFLGLLLTALFYEVFPLPFLDRGRVLRLFDNQVSQLIVGMTLWSLFILMFKYVRFRNQRRARQAFGQPQVLELFRRGVYAHQAGSVAERLGQTLAEMGVRDYEQSLMYRRVLRVLHYVRSAPKKEGLNDLLDYQAQIDVKRLETSYAVLHVFVWAIPILGFIGTVLGIGASVQEFAVFIQTVEGGGEFSSQLRTALGGVTSGLATAFNTTFLALVLVIPVMLLTSLLQKTEEEFLLGIEEYCLEDLVPHLHVAPGEDALAEGYEEHLQRILRLSDTWLGQFEPLVQRLSRQTEMMSHQLAGVQPLVKEFTDRLIMRRGASPYPPGRTPPRERPAEPHGDEDGRTEPS